MNKLPFLILLLGFLSQCTSVADRKAKNINMVEAAKAINLARDEGKLEEAINLAQALIDDTSINPTFLKYDIAKNYASLGKTEEAFQYIGDFVEQDKTLEAITESSFYHLLQSNKWKAIEKKQIERYEKENGKIPNQQFALELFRMRIKDQAFYYELEVSDKKLGKDSQKSQAMRALKKQLNQENIERLDALVNKFGWPKFSEVTSLGGDCAYFVLQHAEDLERQLRLLPLLKEAALAGEAKLNKYAYLEDRLNVEQGKPQNYGTQYIIQSDGSQKVKTLADPKTVNAQRATMGLEPLAEFAH